MEKCMPSTNSSSDVCIHYRIAIIIQVAVCKYLLMEKETIVDLPVKWIKWIKWKLLHPWTVNKCIMCATTIGIVISYRIVSIWSATMQVWLLSADEVPSEDDHYSEDSKQDTHEQCWRLMTSSLWMENWMKPIAFLRIVSAAVFDVIQYIERAGIDWEVTTVHSIWSLEVDNKQIIPSHHYNNGHCVNYSW